jgi:putative ABC transport system ATP-binding protein
MNKRPAKISGGEKQRVALAGLLIKKDVELLLLDEPTGSLDEEHSERIWSIVREVNKQGITIVSVTHDIAVKKYAKKIYQLDYGALKDT